MESESDNIERTKLLHATDSAAVWAEEWCKVAREITVRDGWTALLDEGWMIGWFANAIEHSYYVRTGGGPVVLPDGSAVWIA